MAILDNLVNIKDKYIGQYPNTHTHTLVIDEFNLCFSICIQMIK